MGGCGMTREEQIIEEAQKHGLNCMSRINYQDGFIEGAKWADKTMIEKACKWLKMSIEDYYVYDAWRDNYIDTETLINDLKKEMEGNNE